MPTHPSHPRRKWEVLNLGFVDADDASAYVAETVDGGVGVDGVGNAVGLGAVGELV